MKLSQPQLPAHLTKSLLPIYLINSDEFLLVQEAVDLIRTAARNKGYLERISLHTASQPDWALQLHSEAHSLSLFSNKRIIELHLGETKPNVASCKILLEICKNPLPDTLLIISANKLESKVAQAAWYKALDKVGGTLAIWPIPQPQLPGWLIQRAKQKGITLHTQAANQLAEFAEGNLLAAAQEIEKLSLLQMDKPITAETITEAVTDNARFDIFTLVECALAGNTTRALRMLAGLKAEGIESVLVLWAYTREIRILNEICREQAKGVNLAKLFTQFRIWDKRQPAVRHFVQQHSTASCCAILSQSAKIDRMIKGASAGNVWDALQQLTLHIARGTPCPTYSNL